MHSLPRTPSVTWTSARCYTARQTGGGSCPVTWHWLEQEAAWLPAHLCLELGTHVLCCCCVRLPSLSVLHEVDAKEESPATHISNYLRINWFVRVNNQQSTNIFTWYFSASFLAPSTSSWPMYCACWISFSFSMTSNTAEAMAQLTGLPSKAREQ